MSISSLARSNQKIEPNPTDIFLFQFASSPIHVISGIEAVLSLDGYSAINYFFWGHKTKYIHPLSKRGLISSQEVPLELREWVELAFKSKSFPVLLTSELKFDSVWVSVQFQYLREKIRTIETIEELESIPREDIYPWPAIANAISYATGDRYARVKRPWVKILIFQMLKSYLEVYSSSLVAVTESLNPEVIIYNGRFLHERAVWDMCRANNIPVKLFECMRDKYFLREEGFHDRVKNQNLMIAHWDKSSLDVNIKVKIAEEYFKGLQVKENPYSTHGPSENRIEARSYFVFFTSNDDETVGFWETWKEPLGNQFLILDRLTQIFESGLFGTLVIRIHPNTLNKPRSVQLRWKRWGGLKNTIVIPPQDGISSTLIAKSSLGVLSVGSTIGLQAAFESKPLLLVSNCNYDLLGAGNLAEDWQSVISWLSRTYAGEKVIQDSMLASAKRGFFVMTAGSSMKHSKVGLHGWNNWEIENFCGVGVTRGKVLRILDEVAFRLLSSRIRQFVSNIVG